MRKKKESEMSFLDHLEELRWNIIRSLLVVVVVGIAAFIYKELVFETIIMGPSKPEFITAKFLCQTGEQIKNWLNSFLGTKMDGDVLCINSESIQLQSINMASQFLSHIKISFIGGLIMAFPYVTFEFWSFLQPALYVSERRQARGAVLVISFLFFLGVMFGYFIISPLSINFFRNYQVSELVQNNFQLKNYVGIVASISFASGIMFQLPVVVYFLSKIGIMTPGILIKYRRHALIVILVLSAIITPPDVFSQILIALPLLILYQIGIRISKRIVRARKMEE